MARSLNSVQLIGNLTRDPELRYTATGIAVATIGIATNRSWTTDSGEKKEEADYHRIVAWNKLAELCSQLLIKGTKVYVHGRLTTRSWTAQDGTQKTTTEIVIDDMIVLSGIKPRAADDNQAVPVQAKNQPAEKDEKKSESMSSSAESAPGAIDGKDTDVSPDDIPF